MLMTTTTNDQSSISDEELKQQDGGSEDLDSSEEQQETTKPKAKEGPSSIVPERNTAPQKPPDAAAAGAADGEKESSSSLYRIDSGLLPFPEKLMALLDGNQVSDSMWWLPDGDSFCLIPVVFAEKVLDKHFQGTKFESFTRKLNRWGFKRVAGQKVPANTIAYYNKYFIRGQPKLLKNMNGGKTKMATSRETKREQTKLRRDRQQEQDVLIAAQQQAMYSDNLAYPGTALFRPGLSSLLGGAAAHHDLRANHLLAAEIMAQREREELQMRLALSSQRGAGGYNPLLGGHHAGINQMLGHHQPQGLTPFEHQLLMARNSAAGYPDFSSMATARFNPDAAFNTIAVGGGGGGGGGMDGSSSGRGNPNANNGSSSSEPHGVGSSPQQQQQQQQLQQQLQQHNNNKAAGSQNSIINNNNNQIEPNLLQYLQEEQRKKDIELLKQLKGGSL